MLLTIPKTHVCNLLDSAFRYCCSARGDKLERTNIRYACLARVVREGGFKVALIARFSAIPGHCELPNSSQRLPSNIAISIVTTAVFSTCGMNIWLFMAAAFFSLPKQFVTVYLGVALEQSDDGNNQYFLFVSGTYLDGLR